MRFDTPDRRILFRYLIGGGLAAAAHFSILIALVEWVSVGATFASATGFCAAVAVNYTLQYYWTFASTGSHRVIFLRYLSITLAMLGLNTAVFWMLHQRFAVPYLLAQFVTTGAILIINFTVNRRYTFITPVRS